jgi:malate/lactate dehydrogenase
LEHPPSSPKSSKHRENIGGSSVLDIARQARLLAKSNEKEFDDLLWFVVGRLWIT